jgi:periplasmic protein TonB
MKTSIGLIMCLALFSAPLSARGQKAPANFQPPQVLSTVEPSYPANTVAGGTVVLKVMIGIGGEVQDVQVLQGAGGFTQQAVETVKKWKFAPARLDGKPLTASLPVAFSFSQPIVWWNRKGK